MLNMDPKIPQGKAHYYDATAVQKRALRAARRLPRPPYILDPPEIRTNQRPFLTYEEQIQYWPTPIRRPRSLERLEDSELLANELWCRQVYDIILKRLNNYRSQRARASITTSERNTLYETSCKPPDAHTFMEGSTNAIGATDTSASATRRAIAIPEMLEAILRAASPDTQLTAYRVSSSWRDMAEFVIQSTAMSSTWFGLHHPCDPVQYGDLIDASLDWRQPHDEEINEFERDVDNARQMLRDLPDQHTELNPMYFSARLSQAKRLTQNASDKFQIFKAHQEDLMEEGSVILLRERRKRGETTPHVLTTFGQPGSPNQPVAHVPTWLDFTQFELNPFLTALFADGDRISVVKGRIDIVLRQEPGIARVYDRHRLPNLADLKALIGPMFFTSPPCKQISIGVWGGGVEGRYHGQLQELASYNLSTGVTVNEILRLLEDNADFAVDYWDQEARLYLLSELESAHWKHDIWTVRGLPMLSIVLRNEDSHNQDHWLQRRNMDPRTVRQGEWMSKEMMKPPKPTSPDVDHFLPSIYGIGFHEPVFEDRWKTVWQRLAEYERVLARIIENAKEGRAYSDDIPQAGPPASSAPHGRLFGGSN